MSKIRFEQVSLQFQGTTHPAINHCSCEIDSAELVVILGPSGCGKTTLLKMVNRLYEPDSGKIYLGNTEIRQISATQLRRQMGYVIQKSGLFPHMSVAENIAVVPKLLGWSRGKIQSRIDELLELVKLSPTEYRHRYPSQLSGGQQQRVGIARALAGNPEVMLMDEPFGAIDAITRESLQEELSRLQRQVNKTILFVSHDVEEALHLADRILILQQGEIVQFDTPYNILTQPKNEFVHNLVGADDQLRQLSLLRVETAMSPIPPNHQPCEGQTIARYENLRQALSLILATGASMLTVLDDGKAVGVLTLESIRDAAKTGSKSA
ncbi:MAG: ABC transporter ATP-binding protein [Cyanobacteria bacterium QS_9_48_30]|nr:MAG: ABC transporter ATP-binding protein [Cyanobacteria bacterium QS_9_48_30]